MKNKMITMGLMTVALLATGCTTANPVSSANSSVAQTESETSTSNVQASQSTTDSSVSTTSSDTLTSFKVTVADAIQVYQGTFPDVDITSIDLDSSLGNYYYDIEGVDDDTEYELRIDATTEEIKKNEKETLDKEDQNGVKRKEDKLDLTDILSVDEVTKIAVAEVSSGEPTDWELDKEMGITYWEVKVKDGKTETQIKINAQTGEVLEVEVDD